MGFETIPPELKKYPNWVCWKFEYRNGKTVKIPVNPRTGLEAKANDPSTWGTFDEACSLAQTGNGANGIGFQFSNSPFMGIDLDKCRDMNTGKLQSWAEEIVKKASSYSEISPSGKGVHIILTGSVPDGGNRRNHVEMYSEGRYFTMTGKHLEGTPDWIANNMEAVNEIHRQYIKREMPNQRGTSSPSATNKEALLEKAFNAVNGTKVKKLFEGDWSDYQSQSEADLALCSILAFWADNDPVMMDSVFRQSNLFRPKWDEKHFGNGKTYGQETICKAIETTVKTYTNGDVEQGSATLIFPDIMSGAAGTFAKLYSSFLEPPPHFFYIAFLTCLGSILSRKLTLRSEIRPQPRLYVVLLGESGDARKSTAIAKTVSFFQDHYADFNVSWGVSSAEGLQARLSDNSILLLIYDEFKSFVSKCKIDGSVLLPMCTTLFESNRYESRTKNAEIKLDDVYLALLAASTINTYEKVFDSSFADIGMTNRLFIVPGDSQRRFSFPQVIPEASKQLISKELNAILSFVDYRREVDLTPEAQEIFHEWYMGLENSVHAKRLDVYALRFMALLAVNELKHTVDQEITNKTIDLMNWELQARQLHDPIDSDSLMAKMEEKIRRILRTGPKTERELKQGTHANRTGLWFYDTALRNLQKASEISYDAKHKSWRRNV